MKKTIYLLLLSFFVFVSCSNDEHILEEQSFDQKELKTASENSQGKIYVCHKGNIINVSINSLKAHIEHGDAIDMDGDGYFDIDNQCSETDCDDMNASINPAMEEICDNGVDDNCDGYIDEGCIQIGDYLGLNNYVFYIAPEPTDLDGDGILDNGLAFQPISYGNIWSWGCDGTDLPNVPNVITYPPSGLGAEIGDGMNNYNAMINDCTEGNIANYVYSINQDYFVPSIKELNEIFLNKDILEAATGYTFPVDKPYWSSTEYNDINATYLTFHDGYQIVNNKIFEGYVLPVITF